MEKLTLPLLVSLVALNVAIFAILVQIKPYIIDMAITLNP